MYHIYIHQNKKNLKIYIGVSKNYIKRWQTTKDNAFNFSSREYNLPLYKAIRREGWEGFTHQVIEEWNNKEEALEAEKFWIEFFMTNRKIHGENYGYNLHEGGNIPPIPEKGHGRGRSLSKETKKKMSLSKIGNTYSLGNKASDETKKKMSESAKNKPKSEKAKNNMSDAKKGENHPNFGRTWKTINGKRIYFNGDGTNV